MKQTIIPRERLIGHALGAGSVVANALLPLSDKLGLTHNDSLRLRWKLDQSPLSLVGNSWIEFEGNATAGRTPQKYPEAGVLNIHKADLDVWHEMYGGKQAVAYALGKTAVMVGTGQDPEMFGIDPENPGSYAVAMRIGKGTLKATAGLYTDGGFFLTTLDLVSAGQRLPLNNLPAAIPIV